MSRKLKDRVLQMEPCCQHKKPIEKAIKLHFITLGGSVIGSNARESWAWSEAWQWLVENGYKPIF